MSIEQLQADLEQVATACPTGPLVSAPDVADFLRNNLIPFIAAHVGETSEMDEAIDNLVHQEPDILHEETAGVFASIITSGRVLADELYKRIGTDQRLRALIKEYRDLAAKGSEILDEITVMDPEDPEEEEPAKEATPEVEAPPAAEGNPQ